MNRNVFGFSENPFNTTPDPMFLYLGASYRYAFLSLVQAIHERKGCIALLGKPGTGKTTLINAAVAKLDQKTKSAFLSNFSTDIPFEQLLSAALVDLGATKSGETLSKMDAIDRLKEFAVKQLVSGGNVVLVVDEAQSLNRDAMLNLRLLSNLATRKHKLIQIILVGQPELKKILASPTFGQVNDRIAMWLELETFDRQELGRYITHRMVVAGGRGRVRFTKSALNTIHRYSKGIPRRINSVCDRALLIGYCKDESAISRSTVRRAIDDIRGPSRWDVGRLLKWDVGQLFKWRELFEGRAVQAAAVVLVVFLVATVAGWNLKEQISGLFSAAGKPVFVQSNAFDGNVVPLEVNTPSQEQYGSDDPLDSPEQTASIAMDSRTSLAMLFRLFKENSTTSDHVNGEVYPGLYTFTGEPVLYRKLRKPFRLRITQQGTDQPSYLLIHSVTHGGAFALDSKGNERPVTEDFILSHWDGEMSWVYPYERGNQKLTKGMSGPKVLWLQEMLQQSGFSIDPTGLFDSRTDDEIVRFQSETGLNANGVAGTQTKALLYQMAG
jgi:general secretion pathway protein A